MKKILVFVTFLSLFLSCKQKEEKNVVENELSIAEKIAHANGFENWKNVSQIDFTFNVDVDTTHFERSWSWKPKTDDVTVISRLDTISYNRKTVDSTSLNADKGFVNDKYWLLAPYQLVWDTSATISEAHKEEAPISKAQLNKITLAYPTNGGYTPGDAYDFYFSDDFVVKEWVYRQGNAKEPSMMTTWEDYEDFNGLKIAKTHKKPEGNWNLHFTNIKVKN
jgi:hypothetical protein